MLAVLIDENLNHRILRGLLRLDYILVTAAGLKGADAPVVLEFAAEDLTFLYRFSRSAGLFCRAVGICFLQRRGAPDTAKSNRQSPIARGRGQVWRREQHSLLPCSERRALAARLYQSHVRHLEISRDYRERTPCSARQQGRRGRSVMWVAI